MNEQNRPEEDNPGTKDTEDVSGYAYRPGPPPITPPGRDPVPPQPVPPGIVPPDSGIGDYNPVGSSSTVTPVNRDGGPDDQEAVQGYMVPGVPLPVSDVAPAPVPPPPGPDPYEKDPSGESKNLPPERMPAGIPPEPDVSGYIASVVPPERMPAPIPDPAEKQPNDPNSPIAPPRMPPGVGDPTSPSALDKKSE
jgi:hypothetical protein